MQFSVIIQYNDFNEFSIMPRLENHRVNIKNDYVKYFKNDYVQYDRVS
jgi:hypothetical protein